MPRQASVVVALLASLAATASAGRKPPPVPVQITSSSGDSFVERMGPSGVAAAVIRSNGDLAPGAPGNVDGSHELYEVSFADDSLEQVTASASDSSSPRISRDGLVVVSSDGDLASENPDNADGSYEVWFWTPPSVVTPTAGSLEQITATPRDSFFQTFWDGGRKAFFASKGDLTPGLPGNADGSNEVFSYDMTAKTFAQLTDSPRDSLVRAVCPTEACAVIESTGDLAPGAPGNADGSFEVFLLALDTHVVTQITDSSADARRRGQDATARYLAVESRGDLVPGAPGNADGSQEVFVYDRAKKTLTQITDSALD